MSARPAAIKAYLAFVLVLDLSSVAHITYDHRVWRTGLPVRSAVLKPIIVRSQSLMRPALLNGAGFSLRVSVGDMGEKFGDWGDRGENGVRVGEN
jgi:hypothetical protein